MKRFQAGKTLKGLSHDHLMIPWLRLFFSFFVIYFKELIL